MMKYIIGILLVCTFFGCKEPPVEFVIYGDVAEIDSAKVALLDQQNLINPAKDTGFAATVVKDNKFILKGSVPQSGFYNIIFYKKSNPLNTHENAYLVAVCTIYIEKNGKYTLIAKDANDLSNETYTIKTNVVQQQKYERFLRTKLQLRANLKNEIATVERQLDATLIIDSVKYNGLKNKLDSLKPERSNQFLQLVHSFVLNNKDAILTPYLIHNATDLQENYPLYQRALNNLDPTLKNNRYTKAAKDTVEIVRKIMEKRANLPNISAVSRSGEKLELSNYANKKLIVLCIWTTWSRIALDEINYVNANANKFPNDVVFIFLCANDDEGTWRSSKDGANLKNNFLLSNISRQELIKVFDFETVPKTISVTSTGKVIMVHKYDADDPRFLVELNSYLKKR